uniref:Uncharacterized protein n=1 Tax=Rhizophora mucronata TaxID=61149 RepID=A0A2P2PXR5_RHIMU
MDCFPLLPLYFILFSCLTYGCCWGGCVLVYGEFGVVLSFQRACCLVI